MSCQRCGKNTILEITAKCSDMFTMNNLIKDEQYTGYVPGDIGIGEDNYVEFSYCTDCGQMQGQFPIYLEDHEQDP